jgi:hypothetical protein
VSATDNNGVERLFSGRHNMLFFYYYLRFCG